MSVPPRGPPDDTSKLEIGPINDAASAPQASLSEGGSHSTVMRAVSGAQKPKAASTTQRVSIDVVAELWKVSAAPGKEIQAPLLSKHSSQTRTIARGLHTDTDALMTANMPTFITICGWLIAASEGAEVHIALLYGSKMTVVPVGTEPTPDVTTAAR